MELQASRLRARADAQGRPVLLMEQDRGRWDPLLIRRGLAALARADALGGARGPYALQAALAACTPGAPRPKTPTGRIVALCDAGAGPALAGRGPNRAVAVGMAFGPQAGLDLADQLALDPALANYHWLPSVRGDLLAKLGRQDEARAEFERAAGMTRNARERELLRWSGPLRWARAGDAPGMPSEDASARPCPGFRRAAMPGVRPAAFDHPGDRAEVRQAPHRPGVELYRAHIIRHAFEPHTRGLTWSAIESASSASATAARNIWRRPAR